MKNIFLITSLLLLSNLAFSQNLQHSCGADSVHNPLLTYDSIADLDGNVYKTIAIGNQIWMAENLKTSRYTNGDIIPLVTTNNDWINLYNTQSGAYCWFNNDITKDCPYGKLYNWHVVNDSRKVCPLGWHVSTAQEWVDLALFIDPNGGGVNGGSTGGDLLKSKGAQYWLNNSSLFSNNATGFSGITTGYRQNDGIFFNFGLAALFWTSTPLPSLPNQAYFNALSNFGTGIIYSYGPKDNGICIRCIKDSSLTTGLESIRTFDNISIYPNPSNTFINIDCKNGYQIYSSTGQMVKQSNRPTTQINIADLPTGLYILRTDNKIGRFIKTE